MLTIEACEEIWPLKKVFRISRGSRSEAQVVVVTVGDDGHIGRGEGVPIKRYAQTVESMLAQIEATISISRALKASANPRRRRACSSMPTNRGRRSITAKLFRH